MPTSITFWDADPQRPFRLALQHALRAATSLDVAVAFMTEAGVDFFLDQVRRLRPDHCRLSVSVQFPTNLTALCKLSQHLSDNLHIHRGSDWPEERSGMWPPLMHSKVVWIENAAGEVTIFIGSHNWTSTALDGPNLEAGTQVECRADEPFALAVKAHLDACFTARGCVRFDPDDVEFYQAVQHNLYPRRPARAEREAISDFVRVPNPPAVVIHAEDQRTAPNPDLLLYLPLDVRVPHEWFNTVPTAVYLYLYPRGTLLGHSPPKADPSYFEGRVEVFSLTGDTGQTVDGQIDDIARPVLRTVPSGSMPKATGGVTAQVVMKLRHRGDYCLPVYSSDGRPPGVRVEALFAEAAEEQIARADVDQKAVPERIATYYTSRSVRDGRFLFRQPRPSRSTTIQVPGEGFYRIPPRRTLQEFLEGIEVEVKSDGLPPPYLYQVRFVFQPPQGTHTDAALRPTPL